MSTWAKNDWFLTARLSIFTRETFQKVALASAESRVAFPSVKLFVKCLAPAPNRVVFQQNSAAKALRPICKCSSPGAQPRVKPRLKIKILKMVKITSPSSSVVF